MTIAFSPSWPTYKLAGGNNEKAPRYMCFTFNSSNAYRSMHGTSDNLFDSYLQEYMWKKQHKDIFGNILYWISFYYSTFKVSSAISSLNVCEKTFEKYLNTKPIPVTGYTDISLPEITGPEFNARK